MISIWKIKNLIRLHPFVEDVSIENVSFQRYLVIIKFKWYLPRKIRKHILTFFADIASYLKPQGLILGFKEVDR